MLKTTLCTFLTLLLVLVHCVLPSSALAEGEYYVNMPATTEADYWLASSYAAVGSLAGNGAVFLTVFALDLLPGIVGQPDADWVNQFFFLTPLLLLMPMATLVLSLESYFPKPPHIDSNLWQTILGSALSVVVHAVLMLPMFYIFDQGSFSKTFYLLAPTAVITAALVEGMGTAFFFDKSRHWRVTPEPGGLRLSYSLAF